MLGKNWKNSLTILGYEKFPGCSIISSKKRNYVDNYDYLILWGLAIALGSFKHRFIELLNNKLLGLSPPGGFVSPSGGFASLLFDQAVLKNSQSHLADRNAICILHRSDCAWLCCLLSQFWLFGDQKLKADFCTQIWNLPGSGGVRRF